MPAVRSEPLIKRIQRGVGELEDNSFVSNRKWLIFEVMGQGADGEGCTFSSTWI